MDREKMAFNELVGAAIVAGIGNELHHACKDLLVGGPEALKAYEKICRSLSANLVKRADLIAEAVKKAELNQHQAKAEADDLIRRAAQRS